MERSADFGVLGSADSDPLIKIMSDSEIAPPDLKKHYYLLREKYIKAYNHLLDSEKNPKIDLSKPAKRFSIGVCRLYIKTRTK